MRYNRKTDRYVSKEGLIYRYDSYQDKLILCSLSTTRGYSTFGSHGKTYTVHRIVWETFKGEIPEGMEIDHINAVRSDNRLENLKCVTHTENCHNPHYTAKLSKRNKGNKYALGNGKYAKRFHDHFGVWPYEHMKLYEREMYYRRKLGMFRWEVANG